MDSLVFLDSGPLGMACHPRSNSQVTTWLYGLLNRRVTVIIPEIADYEVRRELILTRKKKSVQKLNDFKALMGYVPISTAAMLQAAELWALTRAQGRPGADYHALDGDVILAAQALTHDSQGRGVIVATNNVSHLNRFVPAQPWHTIV